MEKVTKKEMYSVIATLCADRKDIVEFCEKEIAALDTKAAKAKERAAAKRAEGDALLDKVYAALSEEFQPLSEIATKIGDEDVTVSKITYRLTTLIKEGKAEKSEVTVQTSEGKSRKVMGYRLIG